VPEPEDGHEDGHGSGEAAVRFQVGRGPVSLHLGLHRLVALLARTLAEQGLPLPHPESLPLLGPGDAGAVSGSAAAPRLPAIAVGCRVAVVGLVAQKEFNGSLGVAEEYLPAQGRWAVALDGAAPGSGSLRVKPENLALAADAATGMDGMATGMDGKRRLAWCLLEPPLRALAWCGQVRSGLWARNGNPAAMQAAAYGEPPLAATHRDLDLAAVQCAGLLLGPDQLLATVKTNLQPPSPSSQPGGVCRV
jgi:hypothetical protein